MSAYRVAFHFRFSFPGDKFCNIDRVSKIDSPTMILHGTHDEIVPFWHGQELFLATKESSRFVDSTFRWSQSKSKFTLTIDEGLNPFG